MAASSSADRAQGTTSTLEIERKYDVGPDLGVPDLSGLPGVLRVSEAQEDLLEATYLDTQDLRLRAAGMTLRSRTGGSDAGWHLKLPAGADREEVHAEPSDLDDGVPAALHALVRARTRERDLVPVARLSTRRTVRRLLGEGDQVLLEVADDVVRGEPVGGGAELAWREWEAELVEGERSLLDAVGERLLAAGAEPSGSGSKVGRVLGRRPAQEGAPGWWAARPVTSRKVSAGGVLQAHLQDQVDELVRRDPHTRRDVPDALHKMRVATRRLRSALSTFRVLLDRERTDPLREELRWLAGVLGGARDAEVMHERLRRLVAQEEPDLVLGPVAERVDAALSERHGDAHRVVREELDAERYLRLLDALDALVAEPPLLPLARERATEVLPRIVQRSWKRLDRTMRTAERAEPGAEQDELLHEARKDAKRARYVAEAVVPVFGEPARTYAKAVATLQEVLGEHQDGVVTRDALLEIAQQAQEAGEPSFTYGRLHGTEQARAEAAAARWPEVRAEVSVRRLRRWFDGR